MSDRVVAIHQPNFLPWLGFFDKIAHADVFVLLDDVQFPKTGGTWMNRVKFIVGGAPAWVTVPVRRDHHGLRTIRETSVDDTKPWRDRIRKTLVTNYGRTPHFSETMGLVDDVLAWHGESLAEFNIHGIRRILTHLGWRDDRLVTAGSLGCSGSGTDRLVAIAGAVQADTYLCGGGADGYQEDWKFAAARVALRYQRFAHPVYPQPFRSSFHAGLSIVDALFETGAAATRRLLEEPAQ